jgi:hypothetical protein
MKLIFIIIFLSAPHFCFAQTGNDYLKITGNVTHSKTDVPLKDVSISVTDSKGKMETVQTDSLGKYSLPKLALNEMYTILFYKKKYCTKIAVLQISDTTGTPLTGLFPLEVSTGLFEVGMIKKFRLRFMKKEPIAIARYDSEIDNIVWDVEYIEHMKKRIKSKGGY